MSDKETFFLETIPQTPKEVAAVLDQISDDVLSTMPHALLYQAREYAPKEKQARLSKYEHRAFAREAVTENPLMAIPLAAGVPAYQIYKTLLGARSKASVSQVTEGLTGIGEGLGNSFDSLLFSLSGKQTKLK